MIGDKMNKKILSYLGVAVIAVIAVILIVPRILEQQANQKIFDRIQAIDYQGTEVQVVEKITKLVEQTKAEPKSAGTWGLLAENLYIHDHKDLSVDCFRKAHDLNPEDFRWSYFCAVALDELNSDQAIEWYEKSKLLKPVYPPLSIKLGNRFLLTGATEKAKENFSDVIKSGIRVPHAYLGLAKIAIDKGDLQEAENQINGAVKMAPMYREARALLADIYRRKGNKTKAEETFKIMTKLPERLDLNDPVYYEMVEEGVSSFWCQVRGNNFLNNGDLNNAEEEFKKALEAKPNEASQTSLGYVYQRQNRYEAAMDHYNQALALNPEHTSALNNLAVIYYELGDVNNAISVIKKVLKIDSESVDAYLNMGTFSKQLGQRNEALKYFRRGWELAPADYRLAYQLSWLLATAPESGIRDGGEAQRLAELICENTLYNTPASLDLLGVALATNGQFEKAIEAAEKGRILAVGKKDTKLAGEIKSRLDLYKMNKPYREGNNEAD
jgi:Tfp pilus assembly protein PilF